MLGQLRIAHHHDVDLHEIFDIMISARPMALLLEAANPRYTHEWSLLKEMQLPDVGFIQSMLDAPAGRFLSSIPNDPVAMRDSDLRTKSCWMTVRPSEKFSKEHCIRHLFVGYVHRPITGSRQNIPFSNLRGLNHQLWLDFSHERGNSLQHEPPAYAIASLSADAGVIHTHDFPDTSANISATRICSSSVESFQW